MGEAGSQKSELPAKLRQQIQNAGLPQAGAFPFRPRLAKNARGEVIIERAEVRLGPKAGKKGWVDERGGIWVRDRAHAGVPDHWDVQGGGGADYVRVDMNGNVLP